VRPDTRGQDDATSRARALPSLTDASTDCKRDDVGRLDQ
jgi:hypothetical protein